MTATLTFVPLDSRPFVTLDLAPDELDWIGTEAIVPVADAHVRVRLTLTAEQAARLDVPALKRALLAAGAYHVTVEQTVERVRRVRVEGLEEALDAVDALARYLRDARGVEEPRLSRLVEMGRELLAGTSS